MSKSDLWGVVLSFVVGAVVAGHASRSTPRMVETVRASGPVFGRAQVSSGKWSHLICTLLGATVLGSAVAVHGAVAFALCLWCVWWSVRISLVDIDTHVVTRSSVLCASIGTLIVVACMAAFDNVSLLPVVCGAVLFAGVMKVIQVASRGDLGSGDVTLSLWLGMFAGWRSLDTVLSAVLWAFVCGGAVSLWLVISRRRSLQTHLAFGPFLILGTWIGVLR